jgi:dTMP kinase
VRHNAPLTFYSEPLPGVDCSELQGKLIVIEGPDAVGRSTQIAMLRQWLEEEGFAVLDSGMARSALAGKGISDAKKGNTLGPIAMTLFYVTDFADRLENQIVPALRAGFIVLIDRYIFSLMPRTARGEDRTWIEQVTGIGLVPHAVYYLRAEVRDLVQRVVLGRGAFDYWESGMDMRFGADMHQSFVRYQTRLVRALDRMAARYGFTIVDASRPAEAIFRDLREDIAARHLGKPPATPPARGARGPKARRKRVMRVYLLRHGDAETRAAGTRDADRRLTVQGRQRLRRVLERAHAAKVRPSLILTSPLVRAAETARLAAEVLKIPGTVVETDALAPWSTPPAVWRLLRGQAVEDSVLLVGHEPLLGDLASFLLGSSRKIVAMKKGALLCLEMESPGQTPRGTLQWLLTPRTVALPDDD